MNSFRRISEPGLLTAPAKEMHARLRNSVDGAMRTNEFSGGSTQGWNPRLSGKS
jgi:hypothetical protein